MTFDITCDRRPWLIGAFLIAAAMTEGCCCEIAGGAGRPLFRAYFDDEWPVIWGTTYDTGSADLAFVHFNRRVVAVGEAELLEFCSGSDRVDVRGNLVRNVALDNACPSDHVEYDLSSLPPGEYLMVHRPSSAPEGFLLGLVPGSRGRIPFDGEDAFVTTFIRPARGMTDGGFGDGDGGP